MTFGGEPHGGSYFGGRPGLRLVVGRSVAVAWSTRARAGRSVAASWATRVRAGASVVVAWQTRALIVGSAGRSVVVRWATRRAVAHPLVLTWSTQARERRDVRVAAGGVRRAARLAGTVDEGMTAGQWRAGAPTRER